MKSFSGSAGYKGFEQGPIRPPSEAGSLLIRITRNCPWNRCTFCPVYKGSDFSLRPVDHVIEDIDRVNRYVCAILECRKRDGKIYREDIIRLSADGEPLDRAALNAALQWATNGMQSIFLQDANSLIIKPDRLIVILSHLQSCFPWVKRTTSYARSHTVARISDADLASMAESGLSRIHIGMETGSDRVLKKVCKGVDKATHIRAGQKVKSAGMELSEYLMPGLGGKELWQEHARESADALNQINPDFIRLRSLAVPDHVELYRDLKAGTFTKLTDLETARELHLFLSELDGITSRIKSDHILNLFEDLDGVYPRDKDAMTGLVQQFLDMDADDRVLYQVGRRTGILNRLSDLSDPEARKQVEQICERSGITRENVDATVDGLMKRFI